MFQNKFNYVQKDEFSSVSGTGIVNEYKVVVDEFGSEVLEKTGEHNLYNEIQAYKDQCDMSLILELLDDNNNAPVIDMDDSRIVDLTKMPRSLGSWLNYQHELTNFWDGLPAVVKEDIGSIKNLPNYLSKAKKEYDNNKIAPAPAPAPAPAIMKEGENNG